MDDTVLPPETWQPPPELARGRLRSVRPTGTGIYLSIVSAVMILAAIPAGVAMRISDSRTAARTELLLEEGRRAVAQVTELRRVGKNRTPHVSYAFDVDGVRREATVTAPNARWTALRVGGPLSIRYMADDPGVNHPSEWRERQIGPVAPVVIPGLLAVIGGVLQFMLRKARRLHEDGTPTAGVVTRCRRMKRGYWIRYRFRAEGEVRSGRANVADAYDEGETVCVLVEPGNPRRNIAYPHKLYRLGEPA